MEEEMKNKEMPILISAKQHPTLLPEAIEAIRLYQQRIKKQTGVKPSINGAINALLIIGERSTRKDCDNK